MAERNVTADVFDAICKRSYDVIDLITRCRYYSLNSGEKHRYRYFDWCLKNNWNSELTAICDFNPYPKIEALIRKNQTFLKADLVEKQGLLENIPLIQIVSNILDYKSIIKHCNVTMTIDDQQHEQIQEYCKKGGQEEIRSSTLDTNTDIVTSPSTLGPFTALNPESIEDESSYTWIYILIGIFILVAMLVMVIFFYMKPSRRRSMVSNPLNQVNRNDTDNATTPFSKIADQTLRSDVDTFTNKNPQSSIKLAKKELSSAKRSINKNMNLRDSPRSRSSVNMKRALG